MKKNIKNQRRFIKSLLISKPPSSPAFHLSGVLALSPDYKVFQMLAAILSIFPEIITLPSSREKAEVRSKFQRWELAMQGHSSL